MYVIRYAKPAERYLKKIKDRRLLAAFKAAVDELKADPYIGSPKTGDLSGIYGFDVKYASVNYEVAYRIYEPEDGREDGIGVVVVVLAGTRENFYEELKRL